MNLVIISPQAYNNIISQNNIILNITSYNMVMEVIYCTMLHFIISLVHNANIQAFIHIYSNTSYIIQLPLKCHTSIHIIQMQLLYNIKSLHIQIHSFNYSFIQLFNECLFHHFATLSISHKLTLSLLLILITYSFPNTLL